MIRYPSYRPERTGSRDGTRLTNWRIYSSREIFPLIASVVWNAFFRVISVMAAMDTAALGEKPAAASAGSH